MREKLLPIFFLLAGLEGLLTVAAILRSPSEPGSAVLWGLSAARLVLVALVVIFALSVLGTAAILLARPPLEVRLHTWGQRREIASALLVAAFLGLWCGGNLALYAPFAAEPVVRAWLLRLQPLLVLMALLSAEALLVLWLGAPADARRRWKPAVLAVGFGLVAILVLWWLTSQDMGYMETVPGSGEFREVEAPLMGAQVALAVLLVGLGVWLGRRMTGVWKARLSGWLPSLVIWLLAFGVWSAMPLKASWFADPPRPPNYTWSPNSDAYLYEATAQSLLAGAGLRHPQWGAAVLRPMYSGLLALFHLLGGPGYEDILPFQVAFLALAPVLLYAITRRIFSPAAGALAALMMILRERNALALADTITVSHPKVLMADLPAALGFLLAVWLALRWLERPHSRVYPLLLGGAIGVFLLVRLESFVAWGLLPLTGLVLIRQRRMLLWLRGAALAVLAFVVFVSPWVWRNWQVTGKVYLVSPGYEQAIWERLFGAPAAPQSSAGSPLALRMPPAVPASEELGGEGYRWRHLVNNLGDAVLYLPASPNALLAGFETLATRQVADFGAEAYVRSLPYWWSGWDGRPSAVSVLPLWLDLSLLALGVAALWRRSGWKGLLPLLLALLYMLALAWIGRSGGRWLLEVDWVSMMLLAVGLVEAGRLFVGGEEEAGEQSTPARGSASPWGWLVWLALIALLGLALPVAERVIPRRYTEAEAERRLAALLSDESDFLSPKEKAELQRLLDEGASVWLGRALYPRFFAAGEGMEGMGGMHKRPYPRMEWFLVGSANLWTVFPYEEAEMRFPHAVDVFMVGGQPAAYFDVTLVAVYEDKPSKGLSVLWAADEDR